MSQITNFKLIRNGYQGLSVKGPETIQKKQGTCVDKVSRERNTPIPDTLREKINGLKYHFLMLTGHWDPDWDKYVRKDKSDIVDKSMPEESYKRLLDLWQKTRVQGLYMSSNKISLIGSIEVLEGKPMWVTTSKADPEDDINFEELEEKVFDVLERIKIFLQSDKLEMMSPHQYALDFLTEEEVNGMDDVQKEQFMKTKLEEKGYMIFEPDNLVEGNTNETADAAPESLEEKVTIGKEKSKKEKEKVPVVKKEEKQPLAEMAVSSDDEF